MRACCQRVSRAEVRVDGRSVAAIGPGLAVLLGVLRRDDLTTARELARRVAQLRVFEDEDGRMRHDARERGAELLVVSQITLAWDGRRGRRPSFDAAAPPERARELCRAFAGALRECGLVVREGRFGARMEVELVNEGPVTLVLDRAPSD